MSTLITESPVQWQVITDTDAVEAVKDIWTAQKRKEEADAAWEVNLLKAPSIYFSKVSMAKIAEGAGVSKTTVSIYNRIGRVLSFAPSAGVKPSEVRTLIDTLHNAPGSLGENVDPVLDTYYRETDNPTWAGAMRALKASGKADKVKKTDAQKVDGYIESIRKAVEDKGYVLTDEQKSALATITSK